MNDLSLPMRRRIDLAIEPPFQVGGLRVTPAALEIGGRGATQTVEPRVMQVLVALHQARGEAVGRDELVRLCWQGRIIGDDSIHQSISRLRKALADDEGVHVDTIPKIGYRLRVAPGEPGQAEDATAPAAVRSRFPVLIAGAAALGIVALALAVVATRDGRAWTVSRPRPLTTEVGVQTHPALSPDGARLLYSAGPGFGAPRDILMRGVEVGASTPVRLTDTPDADESAPAWSADGRRVTFVRLRAGACEVVVMAPPNGDERAVGRCQAPGGLAWLGQDEIVFADRARPGEPRRLQVLSVVSGRTRPLTAPPVATDGDSAPAVSPDGRRVAFRRSAAPGSDDLFVIDVASGRERALTHDGRKAVGFVWSDRRTLLFTSNRQGDFGLWALDVRRPDRPRLVMPGVSPLGRLAVDRQSRLLALESHATRTELRRVDAQGGASVLLGADGLDWDPDVAPDGAIVFASNRGGANEIWLLRDGRPRQLTSLDGSYVRSPRWSPDGRQIAFLGVVEGRIDLYVMQADGSALRRLTDDGAPKAAPAWMGGRLVYPRRERAGWRLACADLEARRCPSPGAGQEISEVRRAGNIVYARLAGGALGRIGPDGKPVPLTPTVRVEADAAWAPATSGFYHLTGVGPRARLWFTTWSGQSRPVAGVTPAHLTSLAVDAGGAAVVPALAVDRVGLSLLDLKL